MGRLRLYMGVDGLEKDILTLITKESEGFSKGQRLIANYILDNFDKAAFMTAGKLGKKVGVSESTVVRFAAELGYDGYPGMRKALQEIIRNRLTSVQRIEVAQDLIGQGNLVKNVLSSDMDKLQATIETIDEAVFDAAVSAILDASGIYILGMRSAASLAGFLGYYLGLMLDKARVIGDSAESGIHEQMRNIGKGDLFIGVSYPRYSKRTVSAMRFAKSMGARTVAITDSESSPFAGLADICLFARSDMVSFLDSLVAPLSLINALIVSVGANKSDTLSDSFKRLEKIWDEFDVYEKSDG